VLYETQEQTTRKLKQETMAQLSAKQHKLDMLRNIINQDGDNGTVSSRLRTTGDEDDDWMIRHPFDVVFSRATSVKRH